jgi:N-acetylneuraminate synthase
MFKKIYLVAEIGCNHMGSLSTAKILIDQAKISGADFVKFQKRDNKILFSKKEYNSKHPVPRNSFGSTYGKHRDFLELSISQHKELINYCYKKKIKFACSVWDINSAKEISKLSKEYIKVPSATNLNFEVLDFLCKKYSGDIHISTGMTSEKEIEEIINFLDAYNSLKRTVLYSCTSSYPAEIEDVKLLDVLNLKNKYGKYIKAIGFSGHHKGLSIDNSVIPLGASWIERHFTFDRTAKGTDHAASLEIEGLQKLRVRLNETNLAMQFKPKNIMKSEIFQRKYLKKIVRLK